MKKFSLLCSSLVLVLIFCSLLSLEVEAQNCRSTGKFRGTSPPQGQCSSNCCVENTVYFTFECSPTVTTQTVGILNLRTFQKSSQGGSGGPAKCDNYYHSDDVPAVSLSTGWYNGGSRCGKSITITGNGKTVTAKVVDECDSTKGCDAAEGYHPPCGYNIVAANKAVWKALGVPQSQWGQLNITWSDA